MTCTKNKLDIGKKLAINALRRYYLSEREKQQELYVLCAERISSMNMAKILLKFLREEINSIVVRSVLEDLLSEKKRFIELKFRRGFNLQKIEMELHVSKPQMCLWQTEILKVIEDMLFYRLAPQDVFNLKKILNMIYIINRQIAFIKENCMEFITDEGLSFLLHKQENYFKIYRFLSDYVESESTSKEIRVIKLRILLGTATMIEIAKEVGYSTGKVSIILKSCQEKIIRMLES